MGWIFHSQQATPSDLNVINPSTLCPISEWPHILIHSPGGDCYFGCIQYNCYVTQEIGYRGNIPTKFFFILDGVDINEQLSPMTSLKAPLISDELDELCFSHNV